MSDIQPVTLNDTQAINKVNSAIAQANRVEGLSNAINAEVVARGLAVQNEVTARQAAVSDEAVSRAAADGERPTFSQVSSLGDRPGESPMQFSGSLDGEAEQMSDIPGAVAVTSSGKVIAVNGAAKIAPRRASRIEPGHQYRLRFVVQRSTDTDDPANDAIRFGVRWLDKDKAELTTTQLANVLDVLVASGRLEYQFNLALTDAPNIDAVPTGTPVYFRPFVQLFGGGVTLVEVIEVSDLALTSEWSPDVSEYRREIAGLQQQLQSALDRIEALEA